MGYKGLGFKGLGFLQQVLLRVRIERYKGSMQGPS